MPNKDLNTDQKAQSSTVITNAASEESNWHHKFENLNMNNHHLQNNVNNGNNDMMMEENASSQKLDLNLDGEKIKFSINTKNNHNPEDSSSMEEDTNNSESSNARFIEKFPDFIKNNDGSNSNATNNSPFLIHHHEISNTPDNSSQSFDDIMDSKIEPKSFNGDCLVTPSATTIDQIRETDTDFKNLQSSFEKPVKDFNEPNLMDFETHESKTESMKDEYDDATVRDIKISDLKVDFSDCGTYSLIFLFVSNVQDKKCTFNPNSITVTFVVNYDLFANVSTCSANPEEITKYVYRLNFNLKPEYEIIPEKCSSKITKRCLEIRVEKKNPRMWHSIKEILVSNELILSPANWTLSSSLPFSPNKWTPCKNMEGVLCDSSKNSTVLWKCELDDFHHREDDGYQVQQKRGKFLGFTGLDNLGNTCFMNAVLQCLANTDPLKEYFLSNKYLQDINPKNPLGMKGHMAKTFAQFLTQLWLGKQSSFSPTRLKTLIGEKVPLFAGVSQHDAQELMAFLLDAIHEDLNNGDKDCDSQKGDNDDDDDDEDTLFDSDVNDCSNVEVQKHLKEIADKLWQQYRSFNSSIIIDLFGGQFKSILTCPDCLKKSVKFDPFLFVSLPIPPAKLFIQCIYYARDNLTDMCKSENKFELRVPQNFTVNDLLDKIYHQKIITNRNVRVIQPQPNDMNMPVKFLTPNWLLSDHYKQKFPGDSSQPLLLFELPVDIEKYVEFCVIQREVVSHDEAQSPHLVGLPFIASIRKSRLTFSHLCEVLCSYARFTVRAYRLVQTKTGENGKDAKITPSTNHFDIRAFSPEYAGSLPHIIHHNTENYKDIKFDTAAPFKINFLKFDSEPPTEILPPISSNSTSADEVGDYSASDENEDDYNDRNSGKINHSNRNKNYCKSSEAYEESDDEENLDEFYHNDKLLENIDSYFLSMDWITRKHFSMFPFSIELSPNYAHHHEPYTFYEDDDITLDDCFRLFMEPEVLGPQNSWNCPKCKKLREASKQISFWRLPPILVIQLKRFRTHSMMLAHEKINCLVKFPIYDLDLQNYYANFECKNDKGEDIEPIYDLYAVINHQGNPFWGHYTAYARSSHGEFGWRHFDDSRVDKIDEDEIVTHKAYILFYKRRDI